MHKQLIRFLAIAQCYKSRGVRSGSLGTSYEHASASSSLILRVLQAAAAQDSLVIFSPFSPIVFFPLPTDSLLERSPGA